MRKLTVILGVAALSCAVPAFGKSVIVYGDSFSSGSGEDLRAPDLWPTKLESGLQRQDRSWRVSNRSINGNGLTWPTRCFGKPALDRLEGDWQAQALPKNAIVVVMAGVNDTIQPNLPAGFSNCFDPADWPSTKLTQRLAALRIKARGLRILLATIPPFAGSEFHSERAEHVRQGTNEWVRANWAQRDVIDLDAVLSAPGAPDRINPQYDSGDGLHPNERGAAAIARYILEKL